MKIALVAIGVLVVVVLTVVAIGYMIPVKHQATRQATLPVSADSAYAIVANVKDYPSWRKSVKSVDILPDAGGRMQFRETGDHDAITYSVEEHVPGKRWVTRISDKSLPFGGSWTYEFAAHGTGSTLRITEDGEVYNPVFRFMSRTFFPTHRTIEMFLTGLSTKFGGPVQIAE